MEWPPCAAGEGTRMRSDVPKVLHQLGVDDLAIVVGPDHDAVSADARRYAPKAQFFEQRASEPRTLCSRRVRRSPAVPMIFS